MRGWRTQLILIAVLAAGLGCARIKPPSGGAIDKTPAELTAIRPAEGSLRNGALEEVTLIFSEPVHRGSVLEAVRISPRRLIRSVRWSADTLLAIRFWEPLPAATSVDLFLKPGWLDRHLVAQPEWQVMSFATGDSLLPGWFGGEVSFKGGPSRALHLELFDESGELRRRTRPDRQGRFIFRHLPADGRDWVLAAYHDVDGDSLFDPAVDFADSLADSLVLSAEAPHRLDLSLDIIDPDEPGRVKGQLGAPDDSLGGAIYVSLLPDSFRLSDGARPTGAPGSLAPALLDSLRGQIRWAAAGDSLRPAGQRIELGEEYLFDPVPPGSWWLFAHRDLGDPDSLWDPSSEPALMDPGPRLLAPGAELDWSRLRLTLPADSSAILPDSLEGGEVSP
jgi:hypothetical protein